MNKLDFKVPFSGFISLNFINCFASAYMFMEGITSEAAGVTRCAEWESNSCDSCGNCATKPQALQEKYYFLFDLVSGRSSLRCLFDGTLTDGEMLINGDSSAFISQKAYLDNAGTDSTIDFLFGFAGYEYKVVSDTSELKAALSGSIDGGRPVIARLKSNAVSFAVITGYDGDEIICPDFRAAQKKPDPAISYDGIEALYIFGEKIAPRYTFADGLARIEAVMDMNSAQNVWGGYCEAMGKYGPNGMDSVGIEGKKARMKRTADTMWYVFNCHNFAEVFRSFFDDGSTVYDRFESLKEFKAILLKAPELKNVLGTISASYGYTHDLAWALIGLESCANWEAHMSNYYGEMIELTLSRINENDKDVRVSVAKLREAIENNGKK